MKKTLVILAAACALASGAALAGHESSPTREEVKAELALMRSSGELAQRNSEDFAMFQRDTLPELHGEPRTRAEVKAELVAARESGELWIWNSDDSMAVYRG